jgi:hypothetical protein
MLTNVPCPLYCFSSDLNYYVRPVHGSQSANRSPSSQVYYISHGLHPGLGLGNYLFIHASLLGIAKKNHLRPTIGHSPIHDIMEIDLPPEDFFDLNDCNNYVFGMEKCCVYDSANEFISQRFPQRNISLWGYLQSYKYFHPQYKEDIRRQMKFKPNIIHQAKMILKKAIGQSNSIMVKIE